MPFNLCFFITQHIANEIKFSLKERSFMERQKIGVKCIHEFSGKYSDSKAIKLTFTLQPRVNVNEIA